MATTGTEKYSRIVLTIVKTGTKLTRKLLHKRIKDLCPDDENTTIDEFLQGHKTTILQHKSGQNKRSIFFPPSGITDLDRWDLNMFCFILLQTCVLTTLKTYVENIQKLRNKLLHMTEPTLEDDKYEYYADKLEICFKKCLEVIDDKAFEAKITKEVKSMRSGPLELSETVKLMHTFYRMDQDQRKILEKLREGNDQMNEKLEKTLQKLEDFDSRLPAGSVDVPEMAIILEVTKCSADEEKAVLEVLVKIFNDIVENKDSSFKDDLSNSALNSLREAVVETFKAFLTRGRKIIKVEHKCLMLLVKCDSVSSLVKLLQDYRSDNLKEQLQGLLKAIIAFVDCKDVQLETVIYEGEFWRVIDTLVKTLEETTQLKEYAHRPFMTRSGKSSASVRVEGLEGVSFATGNVHDVARNGNNTICLKLNTSPQAENELKGYLETPTFKTGLNRIQTELGEQLRISNMSITTKLVKDVDAKNATFPTEEKTRSLSHSVINGGRPDGNLNGSKDFEKCEAHFLEPTCAVVSEGDKNDSDGHIQALNTEDQLHGIESFLMKESQRRVIDRSKKISLYDCLYHCIKTSLIILPDVGNVRTPLMDLYKIPHDLQSSVFALLSKHSKQFQSVLFLLVENFPLNNPTGNQLNEFYETVISDCKDGKTLYQYTKLLLYAASTCINTPIYVACRNELGRFQWSYFQPLFTYEGQTKSVLKYITIAMTSENAFYKVKSLDEPCPEPDATGLVGMYLEAFEDISPLEIDVPYELLSLSDYEKERFCYTISSDIVERQLSLQRVHIQYDESTNMTFRPDLIELLEIPSTDAYKIVCQVLINRRDKNALSMIVRDWKKFVTSCDYFQMFNSLAAIDNAIYQMNLSVDKFVQACQLGVQELADRRRAVTRTVNVSSTVGIVSIGMVIAGIALASVRSGGFLGLAAAGGVIGLGSKVAGTSARIFEAEIQHSKMNDIKKEHANIKQKERDVLKALGAAAVLFNKKFKESKDAENIGMSKLSFLTVGSAYKATDIGPATGRLLSETALIIAKWDKTNAAEILQIIAELLGTQSKVLNGILRGNRNEIDIMHTL